MKKIGLLALAVAGLFAISSARAVDFNDIQFWTGSGANQAALVIDWNDGKSAESLIWGYRWNGTATGLDMFEALVNADPHLFAHLAVFSFGTAVSGAGYDLNGNGVFDVSPTLSFDSGGLLVEPSTSGNFDDSRTPTEAGDHYVEGFNSSYWAYYVKSNSGRLMELRLHRCFGSSVERWCLGRLELFAGVCGQRPFRTERRASSRTRHNCSLSGRRCSSLEPAAAEPPKNPHHDPGN